MFTNILDYTPSSESERESWVISSSLEWPPFGIVQQSLWHSWPHLCLLYHLYPIQNSAPLFKNSPLILLHYCLLQAVAFLLHLVRFPPFLPTPALQIQTSSRLLALIPLPFPHLGYQVPSQPLNPCLPIQIPFFFSLPYHFMPSICTYIDSETAKVPLLLVLDSLHPGCFLFVNFIFLSTWKIVLLVDLLSVEPSLVKFRSFVLFFFFFDIWLLVSCLIWIIVFCIYPIWSFIIGIEIFVFHYGLP